MVPDDPDVKAIIDLGTHTILMVTGRRRQNGSIEILDDAHAFARLGKGVDAHRRILPETFERVCGFLYSYKARARSFGARQITAYGTSALRDAANKADFIAHVKEKTGIALLEISGKEEARLTFSGAAFELCLPERYSVLDIGGGSTELAVGSGASLEQAASVDVGSVRLTERFFGQLPPSPTQQLAATATIQEDLGHLLPYPEGVPLVAVAGTATTLGAIDKGIEYFNAEELNGHFMERGRVAELADHLLSLTIDEIRRIPQVHDQRAGIISAGALILRSALCLFDCPGALVSTRGIRYGLLLQAFRKS